MTVMELEQILLAKWRALPVYEQLAAIEFVETLQSNGPECIAPNQRRASLWGLCSDLNLDVTEEDIAESRREMWGSFPRPLDL